ncbi:MAG: YkgJ family cysteine cluster protein, partial [Desulfamplus sp.]|nr:YkgJ family cysteine cluster protein [Desulfamplus sp.]
MKNKDVKEKQAILKQLFMLFDRFTKDMERACAEGCAACCTRNVTLTSLEAKHILDGLNIDEKDAVLTRIANELHKNRMVPKTTINELAKICMNGEEPPEEFADPLWGECPLLSNQRCMVYDLRPFACRAMMSKKRCNVTGFAEMDEYMVTLSNVFMQYFEHIDNGGYFGNLSDILLL